MKKKNDWSLHFTPKGQSVPQLFDTVHQYLNSEEGKKLLGISDDSDVHDDYPTVLHHCFMRKKDVEAAGFSTEICDGLKKLSGNNDVCWNGSSQGTLASDRYLMLQNLQRVGGVAIFVGSLSEGVSEEYDLCKEMGVETVLLDLCCCGV